MPIFTTPPTLCNHVGIWAVWYEMPFYNEEDNPSPAAGPPRWLECYLRGPRAAAGTPASLALSEACQQAGKYFLKFWVVIMSEAFWGRCDIF